MREEEKNEREEKKRRKAGGGVEGCVFPFRTSASLPHTPSSESVSRPMICS